jgi:hypothetical protein
MKFPLWFWMDSAIGVPPTPLVIRIMELGRNFRQIFGFKAVAAKVFEHQ